MPDALTAIARGGGVDAHLDLVLDRPGEVADDEGGLHDRRGDKVLIALVLLLELGQQGDVCGVRETETQREREGVGETET